MSPAPWYKAPSPNKNRRYPGLCTDSQQEATRQGWSPAQRVESKWTDAPSIRCREKTGYQGRTQGRWERERVTFTLRNRITSSNVIICKINVIEKPDVKRFKKPHRKKIRTIK